MKWSWKVGKIAGISVNIHATFLILIAWVALEQWGDMHTIFGVSHGIIFVFSLFACVVVHEFGHALVARRYGIVTRDINLLPIGGISRMEGTPSDPKQELWIALAGPLTSLGLAATLYLFLWGAGTPTSLGEVTRLGSWDQISSFAMQLMFANVVLALFNLLPAFPMDGGRILRALLAARMDYAKATEIAANVGQGFALLLGVLGLFGNPFLLLIALFVWVGAAQEATITELKSFLAGIPVGQVTVTEFDPVSASDRLGKVVQLMVHGTQQDFPVIDNGHLLGILTRTDLVKGLSSNGPDTPVGAVMRCDCPTVSSRDMLQTAIDKLGSDECHALLVLDQGTLLGLFTLENLAEFVMLQRALRKSRPTLAAKTNSGSSQEARPRFVA